MADSFKKRRIHYSYLEGIFEIDDTIKLFKKEEIYKGHRTLIDESGKLILELLLC